MIVVELRCIRSHNENDQIMRERMLLFCARQYTIQSHRSKARIELIKEQQQQQQKMVINSMNM